MIFISRNSPSLRVVIVPSRYLRDAYGSRTYVAGKDAQFQNGRFETEDKEIIEKLKKSASYGVEFFVADEPVKKNEASEKLKQDQELESEMKPAPCSECGKRFDTKKALDAHIRLAHPKQ